MMMETIQATEMLPGLERIRARFITMLVDRLDELEQLCDNMYEDSPDMAALEMSKNILHKIAGSAGTLGMTTLGDAARTCENQIISFLESSQPGLEQIFDSLGEFAELAERIVAPSH